MPTTLAVGDVAIVQYDTSTDAFSFVFLRDIEAGTIVNFTDNGWLAAGGFRSGEGTVTYTAPSAIAAGTIVTLSGLDLDAAGDQIIAYQGDAATPTILHLVDFADGNTTVAGDATNDNTTALPPGFTLGVNAVAVPFDTALYDGPLGGSPGGLFAAVNNPADWLGDKALPVPFFFDARPTIDLDANNSSGALGFDYLGFVGSGGTAVPISDTDVAINDADDFDLLAAQITIIGASPGDLLAITGSLPFGIVARSYDAATGVLRLDGLGLHSDYETAIRQVRFSTSGSPGDLKIIQVSVFDGVSWSHDTESLIHIVTSLGGAPPALDLDANNSTGFGADATATYTAGGAAKPVTDIDVTITDADSTTIASATINILGWSLHPGDLLSVAGPLPGGITASSYNPFTGVLTLSGVASLADYQTALHQVVYHSALSTPSTADRAIQVNVNDGISDSNFATMYIHVVIPPPNIAPVLDLDADNSTTPGTSYLTGFTEGGPPVAIVDTDVFARDIGSPTLASATITLTNPQTDDVLTFAGAPPAGITVSGSGTTAITLTGTALSGSYQIALQQVKFSNGNIDPSNITRTIDVVVSDGISNSNVATAVVQVEAVNNSAPVVDLDPNDSGGSIRGNFHTSFTEGGAPIPIADTDVTITDLDSTTLVSATITLANRQPGDLLTVVLPLPDGITASAYNPTTGVLTLTGTATLAAYQIALQKVDYSNSSDDPATIERFIEVVVSDGANTGNVAAAVVSVVAVDDPPVLTLDPSATYVENAAPVALSPLATLADVDNTDATEAVVRISDGTIPGDGDTLTVGGLTSGTVNGITFLWHPTEHAMVLTGASSFANYQALLQTVEFSSTSDNPTDFDARTSRTLTWSVSDGVDVATGTTTLNIVAVNDAPQTTVAAAASYTENAAPVVLSPASTVTDPDNSTLVSGEVRIVSTAQDGDLLTVNGLQSGTFSGIDFSYDAALHDLTFTGPTTVADYQAFLQAVAFSSTSDNPTDSGLNPTRTLSWFVFDGDALSAAQTTVVSLTAVADPPVNTVPGAQSANEDTTLPIAGVSVADADSTSLTTTLSVANGTLNVTTGGGALITGNGTDSVVVSGTAAQINSALAGLNYRGDLNFNGADTLTVTTSDGALNDTDTVPITVTAVNDPPVNTVPGPLSVNEDTVLPIGVSVADVDSTASTELTTTLTVASGTLNVSTSGGAVIIGNGTGTVTLSGSLVNINNSLAGLSYRGNPNFNGADTLTVATSDGALSDIDTVPITVNAVNDQPVNTVPGAQSINEDTTLSITGVSVADVDSTALSATLSVANGTLNVTTGGGATIGGNGSGTVTISGSAAQIDSALAGLSYRGNLNFNGADTLTITTSDGASSDTDTVPITVTAVNDAPVNTVPGALSVNEDTALPIGVSVADLDSTALTTTLSVTNGTLHVTSAVGATIGGNDTGSVTISGTVAQINTALAALSYRGNLNFNGSDTLTVTTSDGALSDTDTVPITINAVNDPPVNTVPGAQSVNEDTTLAITGVSVADVDSTALTTTLSVASGTLNVATGGGATIGGNGSGTVTLSGTAAQIDNALGGLSYRGNLNFHGADTLTVTTSDGALNDTDTMPITVNAVNDPPVNTVPGAQSVNEDTALAITGVSVADVDGGALTTTLTVADGTLTVATGGAATLGGNGTGTVTISGTATQINSALGGLSYRGNLNFNGSDTLTVITSDGSLSDTDTVPITVTAVNDPPVNTVPGAQSVNEDTALPITGVSVADVDSTALTATLSVASGTLNVATGGGAVITGDGSDSVTISGTAAQINSALGALSYLGDPDFNGADTLTVITSDGALSDIDTVPITVTAVNDPPVNTVPGPQSVNEDATLPITGLSVADVDSSALTTTLTVVSGTLTVAARAGTSIGGSGTGSITLTGTATQINNALATLHYQGNPDFNGSDTLTVTTSDGLLNDTDTVLITVNAVNDPPVNTVPGPQTVAEDTPLPIAGVSVADVDSTALTTTLSVSNGTLNVTTGGAAVIAGDGTATVTISGTAAEINSALGGLSYLGSLDFNGSDTLTVTTSDGSLSDTDVVGIAVGAAGDPPVNTVPGSQTGDEDTVLPIAGISVADIDSTTLTTTLSVASGTLVVTGAGVSGSGTATVTITGSPTQINTALGTLSYLGNPDFNGADTLTVSTFDGSLTDTDTVAITINAVDDAPVNDVAGAQTVNEDTTLLITGVSVADVDSTALTTTLTVAHGTLTATGTGVSGSGSAILTITGTDAEINAALGTLGYLGDLNFHGPDTLTVVTSDGSLSDTDTVPITVQAVNDAPVNTVPPAQVVDEDTLLPIAGLSVADVDSLTLVTTLTVAHGVLTATGVGVSGDGTATMSIAGTAAQVNAALATLGYRGNPDFNGADTLTVTTSDSSLSDTDTVPITVNAVDDAPVNTVVDAQSVDEDTALPIAGVSVADVDSAALTTTLSVASGTLNVATGGGAVITGNGSGTVVVSGTAAEINTALVGLSYLGNPDFNGPDTLTVATSDGLLTDTDTVAITVNAVNDAPVNTVPPAQSVNEDTALPIAGVSVADVDSVTLTTTLSVTNGTLNVIAGPGVSGDGTGTVSITGTAAQINTALAGLSYLGNLDFNGPDTLTVTTSDGALTDTDTVAITVNAVNDAPVNTVPGVQSVDEDSALPIAGVSVADIDSAALTTTLSVASGTLNVATGGGAVITGNGSGTVIVSGTAAEINTALAGLSYLGNLNFHGADTLTVATSDGELTDTDSVGITVNAVDDPPVNTVPPAQSVNEDTVLPIAGLSVADVDSPELLTTLTVAHGTLTATGAGVSDSGTNTVVIVGTAAEINAALGTLTYLGDPDFSGADTLTVATSDGSSNDTDTVPITVTAVDDAPVNTVPGAQSLNEDASFLVIGGLSVADIDSTALTTTLTVASGTLTVTGGSGATIGGNGTGSVTIGGTAAQINDALSGLRYVVNLNFNGVDTLTVTTSDGSSSDTDTVAITVNPVNDAPVNTVPPAQIADEDTALPIAGLSVADVDSTALVTTLTVAHGTLTATGTGISGSGTATLTITGTSTEVNAALGTLSYLGALNFNGADTLTVTTSDGSLSDTDTVPITVNAVNDTPVNTVPGARSVNEDTTLSIGGVSVADVDSTALVTTLTVAHGTLSATGAGVAGSGTATLTISGDATQINTALGTLSYRGDLDFNGPDTLTVSTSDGALTDTDTVAITVNPVNDPPVNTVPGAQSVNEDTALPIGGVSVADVDGPSLTTTLSVTSGILTVGAGGTVSNNGTGSVTISGSAAEINTALATLSYLGDLGFNGLDTLTVSTSDGSLTDTDTVAITVNPVNSPPVNTVAGPLSVSEDTVLPLAGGVSVDDVDSPSLVTTLTVAHGTLSATGASVLGSGSATITISGSAAQINTALRTLNYLGDHDFNGPDTLTVSTSDGALTGTDTVAIIVTAVNDPPVNTVPGPQTAAEDTALPIAGVSVADVDSTSLTTTLSVASGTIHVTAGTGVAGNDSASVIITGTATEINAALAGLSYTGGPDFNGSDTLTVSTSDGALTDADTVAITVSAVDDPPVNTVPGPQTVAEDTALPIAGVSVADVDSPSLVTTLSVTSGTVHVTAGTGVVGNDSASVTITGTPAEINAALAGLSYTGNLDFNGSDTLTVTTDDGALTDTDTVAITVSAVNDPPVNTVPGPQTVAEDTALPIGGVSVADPDGDTLTTTLTVLNGTVHVTAGTGVAGNDSTSVIITGTQTEINAALAGLSYTGGPDFNGSDTLTVTTSDGTTQDIDTVAITVTAVNDPPVNTVPGPQTVAEDTALPIAGVSVADVDSPSLVTTLSVTSGTVHVTAGTGVVGNDSASVTITGTPAEINAALAGLSYTGNLDFNGSDTLTVTTDDGALTDTDTVAITVSAVNDAPVNTVPGPQTVAEDTALPIAGVSVADPDGDTLTTTLTVLNGTVHVTAGTGVAGNDSASVIITGTATEINAALAGLSYTGGPDFNGSDTLTVSTSDGALTDADTVAITVSAVDDPPVNTVPGPQTVAEDTALPIAGVSVADVDSPSLVTTLSVTSGTVHVTAGTGVVGNDSASVTITGTPTEINAALAGLSYTGGPDFNGSDTLTVSTSDGALTDTDTVAITVSAVDDPPVNTVPGPQTVAEDTALAIVGVSVADVDSTSLTTTLTVTSGTVHVTAGTGVVGNDSASVIITGTALEINAALAGLSYTGGPDFNGSDTLTVSTSDGALTDTDTVAITVSAVNDPPVNTVPGPQTVAEDTALPIAGVSVADVDSPSLVTTLSVTSGTVHVTAGTGVAGNDSASVTITGTSTEINAALAGLSYTGGLDFNGSDTLTVSTSDGALTDTDTVAITVSAVDDAPVNTVPGPQTVAEDTALPIAGVSVADPDGDTLTTTLSVAHGTLSATGAGGSGTATLTITGTAAQINTALGTLSYLGNLDFNGPDTLTVSTSDGALTDTDTVAITVSAVNDPPVNTVPGPQSVGRNTTLVIAGVSVADPDGDTLTTTLAVLNGTLHVTAGTGVVTNDSASVIITGTQTEINAALAGLSYTGNLDFNGPDTLTITSDDGTVQDIDTVAITVDAPPVNTVPGAQSVAEDTVLAIAGMSVVDADSATLTTTLTVLNGTLHVTAGTGVVTNDSASVTIMGTQAEINAALAGLSYTGSLDFNGSDTLTITSDDGTAQGIDTVAITVNPVNDPPVVGAPLALGPIDASSGAHLITQATLLANASDVDGPSLTAINLQISKGLGTLTDNHDGTWTYTPQVGDDSFVNFAYQVTDGIAAPVADSATLDIVSTQSGLVIGTPFDDTFTAGTGNSAFDALGAVDTINFGFKLTEATVTYVDNQVIIDGPASHTVTIGFEIFTFTDGTVNDMDGDRLVEDLFYYSRSHDVWNAHVDADTHYHTYGWHEGRDPDAFFSTSTYLSLNPSVKASGVDPLIQFDQGGWKTSDPSIFFDNSAYLDAYPDVKAAGADPLAHYLTNGYEEGRHPIAPTVLLAPNGFDYVYYLHQNPDVATSRVDPLQHYETVGWKEGRNPNALFDTAGYLANYADVAAAGINPLDHYDQVGWKEGRDPSVNFDTKHYLAAYPDVAAAHIDPLLQYLQFGQFEGRTPHGDGVWS